MKKSIRVWCSFAMLASIVSACAVETGSEGEPFADEAVGATEAAVQSDGDPPPSKTIKDLEGEGYTCEVIGAGAWECTKSGAATQICSGLTREKSSCGPKPRKVKQPVAVLPANPLTIQLVPPNP